MRYDLYINGRLCDLSEQSLIVLTYTMEQLTNPTAVKNTYSHEVELPQTANNDAIFSHFYRNDYRIGIANFSPLERVPFVIFSEVGEKAEEGYIKLQEIKVDNTAHTYKVTLYGGLGSFFYSMAYDEGGEVLSLADLRYMPNTTESNSEALLDLRIDRLTISRAWERIAGNSGTDDYRAQYDVINFAPTYQGTPEGEFDKSKALFVGRSVTGADNPDNEVYGITAPQGSNKYYKRLNQDSSDSGYRFAMVDLGADHTEWEMKDLRTYLQRPMLSVRKFFEAVQRRATELGYALNLDSTFFNENNAYYAQAWMTLPSLQSLTQPSRTIDAQISGEVVINGDAEQILPLSLEMPTATDGYEFGTTISDFKIAIDEIKTRLQYMPSEVSPEKFYLAGGYYGDANAWFVQIYGTTNDKRVVAWSDTKIITDERDQASIDTIVNSSGYTPKGVNAKYEKIKGLFKRLDDLNVAFSQRYIQFNISSTLGNPTVWNIRIVKVRYSGSLGVYNGLFYSGINLDYVDVSGWIPVTAGEATTVSGTAKVSANKNIRSGAVVTKRKLLDIGKTPLDILLSYSKLFGLVWHYDHLEKSVTLYKRENFYHDYIEDWSDRIDRSRDMVIKPFEFDKRFYDFELEAQGQWAKEYAEKYGATYGRERVNTGYDFDSENKNLLEGNSLKTVAEVLQLSKYYTNITEGGKVCPSVFVDGGKYSLYDASGDATEYDITTPTTGANIDYFNTLQGYDYIPKAQLHDDGKLVGDGCALLLYKESIAVDGTPYERFRLSDDIAEMSLLNEGVPCWILEGSSVAKLTGEAIPHFVRVNGVSLDMGVPQEIDNPDADTTAIENTIYRQYWANYLGDRYDANSRVCVCYVDLRGVQVSNALFRNFYYFDGAVWVLNRIINYSMTTVGTTQCEFVKVQDVNNYKG